MHEFSKYAHARTHAHTHTHTHTHTDTAKYEDHAARIMHKDAEYKQY